MKTAISVEDALMKEADGVAKNLGLSRSGLISAALREYLLHIRQANITERLNKAHSKAPTLKEQQLVRKLREKMRPADEW